MSTRPSSREILVQNFLCAPQAVARDGDNFVDSAQRTDRERNQSVPYGEPNRPSSVGREVGGITIMPTAGRATSAARQEITMARVTQGAAMTRILSELLLF